MEESSSWSSESSTTDFILATATPVQQAELKLYDFLMPAIALIVICLNGAVVVSSGLILKRGQQPKSTYLFLGNLAMADLVTALALLFGQFYPKKGRTVAICSLQIGMIVSSTLASVYSVGLIAVDRYLYIVHGLRYQQWVYPNRARAWILASWIIGVVIGFLPLFGWTGDTQNGRICWFIKLAPKNLILLTVLVGIVPMATVVVLYGRILYYAIAKIVHIQRSIADQQNPSSFSNQSQNDASSGTAGDLRMFRGGLHAAPSAKPAAIYEEDREAPAAEQAEQVGNATVPRKRTAFVPSKWRAVKVVLFTSGSFLLTWGPYFGASLAYAYCADDASRRCKNLAFLVASPLAVLGFLNSLANPVIYAWWHQGFRAFVRRKWDSLRKTRKMSVFTNGSTSARKTSTTTSTNSATVAPQPQV